MRGSSATTAPTAGARSAGRSRCRRRGRRGGASGRPRGRARGCRGGRRRSARRALEVARRARAPRAHRTSAALRRTSPRPAARVSSRWLAGRVVDGERRGEPALGPVADAVSASGVRGDQRHARAGARGGQRGVEAGRAGADDGDIARARGRPCAGYGIRVARRVLFHHPASLAHDTGPGHPERPERIVGARARAGRARLVRLGARRVAGGHARAAASAVHPADARGRDRGAVRGAAAGAIDADTVVVAGVLRGGAARRRRRACALVDALLGGEAPSGVSAHRPPGHHAEAGAGDGLLPLQQRRGRRRGTRSTRTAPSGC